MDLGNLVETIVSDLLIGGMTCLSCSAKVSLARSLVCMVTEKI